MKDGETLIQAEVMRKGPAAGKSPGWRGYRKKVAGRESGRRVAVTEATISCSYSECNEKPLENLG